MLRPVKDVLNYKILATDGEIGSVIDMIVDDRELKLRYLVIEKKRIKEAPEYKPEGDLDRDYERRLHDYYRVPDYWL